MKLVCLRCKITFIFEDGKVRQVISNYPCPKCKNELISYKDKEAREAWTYHFRKVHTGYKYTTILDPVSLQLVTTEMQYFKIPTINGVTYGNKKEEKTDKVEKIIRKRVKFKDLDEETLILLKSILPRKRIKT